MRVVLDTNVLVSRILSPKGTPARLFQRWEEGRFAVIVSEPILTEYRAVLRYERLRTLHRLSDDEIDELILGIVGNAERVETPGTLRVVADDPDDDKFIECAVVGRADLVVSGNRHLLSIRSYEGVQILTPALFLTLLDGGP